MFKIKLSILLLTSIFLYSCTNNQFHSSDQKYSLEYIGGGYDGLLLKNYLLSSLKNLDIYDPNSNYKIKANISHTSNIYITNIDNTSDRERIITELSFQVIDAVSQCQILNEQIEVSQFYIYASSDKFLSNQTALRKIKKNNTESLASRLINKLRTIGNKCDE
jgi:hypothetical protein